MDVEINYTRILFNGDSDSLYIAKKIFWFLVCNQHFQKKKY